jgi:hypothetical protein
VGYLAGPETSMKQNATHLFTLSAIAAFALVLPSCSEPKGPAERAGEAIDAAVEEVSDAVEEAGRY